MKRSQTRAYKTHAAKVKGHILQAHNMTKSSELTMTISQKGFSKQCAA